MTSRAGEPRARATTLRLRSLSTAAATKHDTPLLPARPLPVGVARATLTLATGAQAGRLVRLESGSTTIGRGQEADLQIDDPTVSRVHARIARRPNGLFFVEDLASTNGTFVGPRRVSICALASGDRIQLGPKVLLRFALTDPAEEELQMQLYESSVLDPLTRTYNRRHLVDRLTAEIAHARRRSTPLAALMLDVDRFKEFNDRHGHFVGDRILCFVATLVMRLVRVEDVVARYGGDEFVILARETDHGEALALAERLRDAVRAVCLSVAGGEVPVTLSIGVASLAETGDDDEASALLELADARLLVAKLAGRNQVCAVGSGRGA